MSDAVNSLPTAPTLPLVVSGGGNGVPSASAAAANLPPTLANLAAGNVITGTVVERARGVIVLKTDNGLLKLSSNLALKIGAEVVLEVQSVGAQVRFAVLAVDQRAPGTAESESAPTQVALLKTLPSETEETAAKSSALGTPGITGRIVNAIIVAPPEAGGRTNAQTLAALLNRMTSLSTALDSAAASLPSAPGTETQSLPFIPNTATLEKLLAAIEPLQPEVIQALLQDLPTDQETENPVENSAPPPVPNEAAEPNENTEETPTQTPGTAHSAADLSTENGKIDVAAAPKQFTIRLLDVTAPTIAVNARSTTLRPFTVQTDSITLAGTVVKTDTTGVEVTSALGKLRLLIPLEIEVGSQLTFEVVAQPESAGAENPGLQDGNALAFNPPQRTLAAEPPRDWPAVRDLTEAFTVNDSSTIANFIPKAGEALGPALIAFLAAVRSGNAKSWLGKAAIDSLDATTRDHLVDRLTGEIAAETQASNVVDSDGWQTVSVPVVDGGRINEIRFHMQKRGKGRKDDEEAQGNRFIVEATLSALGPLQLDGLVRMNRLDLMVRTARAMPAIMRQDIETLFVRTLSENNCVGGVNFRSDIAARQSPTVRPTVRVAGVIV